MTAALHGPWWLKILGPARRADDQRELVAAQRRSSAAGLVWPVAGAVIMLALVVLVILRWRRPFAWWEFAVIWALVGGAMAVGVGEAREAKRFGFEVSTQLLQQTAALLGYLALPAAIVAGAAVAEITVRATVAATRTATRLAPRRWPFVDPGRRAAAPRRPGGAGVAGPRPGQPGPGRLPAGRWSSWSASPRSARSCCGCAAAREPPGGVGAGRRAGLGRVRHRGRAGRAAAAGPGAARRGADPGLAQPRRSGRAAVAGPGRLVAAAGRPAADR